MVCCSSLFSCLPKKRHFKNLSKKEKPCLTRKIGMMYKQTQTKKNPPVVSQKMKVYLTENHGWKKISPLHMLPRMDVPVFSESPGSLTTTSQRQLRRSSRVPSSAFRDVSFVKPKVVFLCLYRKNGTASYRFRKNNHFGKNSWFFKLDCKFKYKQLHPCLWIQDCKSTMIFAEKNGRRKSKLEMFCWSVGIGFRWWLSECAGPVLWGKKNIIK